MIIKRRILPSFLIKLPFQPEFFKHQNMKKIFFMLLATTTLFTSCSSEDGPSFNTPAIPDSKEYKVDLTIKSSAFSVDKNPLVKGIKPEVDNKENAKYYISQLQVIAYKESGEVAKDTLISTASNSGILINANDPNQNTFSLSLKLPAGKYTLAVIGDNAASVFVPKNFNTDNFDKSTDPSNVYKNTNRDTYYESTQITVNATNNNQPLEVAAITLKPMWSQVDIEVTSLLTAKIPESTTQMRIVFENSYRGFSLKTKKSTEILPWIKPFDGTSAMDLTIMPIQNKSSVSVRYWIAQGEKTNFAIDFEFLKVVENVGGGNPKYGLIETKKVDIDSKYQFENGYLYNINVDMLKVLGDAFDNPSFGITIEGQLIDKNLEF